MGNTHRLQDPQSRTSVSYHFDIPRSPRCAFSTPLTSAATLLQPSVKTGAFQEASEKGVLAKFSSLCQLATLLTWLCLFSSYCLQTLSTEHQGRSQDEKKNHCKLDHSKSVKILAWTQLLFPPSFTTKATQFTREVIKA